MREREKGRSRERERERINHKTLDSLQKQSASCSTDATKNLQNILETSHNLLQAIEQHVIDTYTEKQQS